MDLDNEKVLKIIFPNGVPNNLQDNPEVPNYLYKLGLYKVDQLKKEDHRLSDELKSVVEQTQDLAITNYKTFIQTAECSREIFKEFNKTSKQLDQLIDKLPDLSKKCQQFIQTSGDINASRRLNSLTLKRNAQLLEILELPQLMETCIREERYEEALELATYVQRLGGKHGSIPIIADIVSAVDCLWQKMLRQLLAQLRTDIQLPKCLQVVGYLRRMQAFTSTELKLKFLQARNSWFDETLSSISESDPQQHLTKTIELTRVNLFNIITQYKATFGDDDKEKSNINRETCDESSNMYYAWLNEKINNFLKTLEQDLLKGVTSLDTILDQCMYFGLSFSRVGADFRGLMCPIFTKLITSNFNSSIIKSNRQFDSDMENYTFINKFSSGLMRSKITNDPDGLSPPENLLDFQPLAIYCNNVLIAFNELRSCAPLAIADDVTIQIEMSLENVSKRILIFYRQEQQAFSANERDAFIRFCSSFAYDLIPYVQRCIHALFTPGHLAQFLGINLMTLHNEGITYLRAKQILKPIERLLPDKVDAIIKQVTEKKLLDEAVAN